MPRVKIDYVVSFSSESPEAPASNLLANDAGRGRWLCARGEPSCSVLLQLSRAVQISSVTIGAHLAALVEVLVGRSETPNEPFQVLVASSVFLSPLESRRVTEGDAAADRVRSFNSEQLAADVRTRRWDRLRVVCSQPYNKLSKYGLSFIHIFSPEGEAADISKSVDTNTLPASVAKPPISFSTLALDPQDSDDDEFKPGTLFAQHRAASQSSDNAGSTGAQIRLATSQAIKHMSDSSTKLIRTPIAKPRGDTLNSETRTDRHRDSLMYSDEDAKPNEKMDKLVAAHKDQQAKTSAEKTKKEEKERYKDRTKLRKDKQESESSKHSKDRSRDESDSRTREDKHKEKKRDEEHRKRDDKDISNTSQSHKRQRSLSKQEKEGESSKKQKVLPDGGEILHAGPVTDYPYTLLSDVVFVLSGYENPRRAAVRDAALAMGARFQRDWGADCTHLICAFPNTPKLKAVRSSPNGTSAVVVTAEWVERCAARRRRLPWQWFATEGKHRVTRARSASGEDPPGTDSPGTDPPGTDPPGTDPPGTDPPGTYSPGTYSPAKKNKPQDSECDTDDEIERVMGKQRAGCSSSPDRSPKNQNFASPNKRIETNEIEANCSQDSDVAFVRDERIQGNVSISDSDTDDTVELESEETEDLSTVEGLPSFFEGQTFALRSSSPAVFDESLIKRYVRAYGGEIVEPLDDEEIEVDYVLSLSGRAGGDGEGEGGGAVRGRRVRADWVWRCHERRRLCSMGEYALS